jgi:hypothetical protein
MATVESRALAALSPLVIGVKTPCQEGGGSWGVLKRESSKPLLSSTGSPPVFGGGDVRGLCVSMGQGNGGEPV